MQLLSNFYQNQPLFFAALLWDAIWKGFALWKSARKGQKYWFVALLFVNSFGLFPIIYLLLNRDRKA